MMTVSRWAPLALALTAAAVYAAACGSSGGGGYAPLPDASIPDTGSAPDTGSIVIDASHGAAVSLAVDPPTTNLVVTDIANLPTAPLAAKVTYADNTVATVPASWTIDRFDIASVSGGAGVVTPTGSTFGSAIVTAKALGLTGKAAVKVDFLGTVIDPAVPPGDQTTLKGATGADPNVTKFAYPYDQTVFPRGILPPESMWNGGATGDSYMLHYTGPSFDLTVFAKLNPPGRYTLTTALWNALTSSLAGGSAAVELRRLSGANAYVSAKQTWKVADANLRGAVYYWAINQGQIYKIDLPTGQRSPVFDSGPNTQMGAPAPLNNGAPRNPPWQDNGAGKRCVACHSVSKDGSRLTSAFSREASEGPLGFVDLGTGAVTSIGDYEANTVFNALAPDGSLAVLNSTTKTMKLLDATTAQPVASALDALADVCDPSFSPDGKLFAYASTCDPGFGYPVEYATADLSIMDFAQGTRAFANPRVVVKSAGKGDAIAFPSFSPDARFVFIQRGDYARAKYGTNQHGNDDLFVVPALPGSTAVALDNANGKGVLPADSLHLNYAPTVNPIAEGGYVWVVFTSPRDYGNRMVSPQGAAPNDATYANHKQLWVTAVDANIGVADPSHPAFWLPGQDANSANMFGYWALAKCKPTQADGGVQSCSAGFECCSGFCRDTGSGPVCVDNGTGCSQVGEKCAGDADCCNAGPNIKCIAGICQKTRVN